MTWIEIWQQETGKWKRNEQECWEKLEKGKKSDVESLNRTFPLKYTQTCAKQHTLNTEIQEEPQCPAVSQQDEIYFIYVPLRIMIYHDTGGLLTLIFTLIDVHSISAIILSGAPNSYARYPKWAHSFENSLSFEFKTRQSHGLLLYTDDGGVNGNFYSISISDGRVQLDFRGFFVYSSQKNTDERNLLELFHLSEVMEELKGKLGDNANDFGSRRVVNTIRIEEIRVDDDRWHSLALFQSWENVKMELDASLVFKILNQRSFIFGNILKNSDVFVGGVPQGRLQRKIVILNKGSWKQGRKL
ncbi:laminin G domain protein [Ancylostoma ceylanicum]|uniref:Laminin G domain protein n=1 Tax=Ancylostoma ceylanicum TaxID=53326 RepID=A0A0D6M0J3_9BILA|nr:laminin G domain protein [Ancylostoma ceylanicum]